MGSNSQKIPELINISHAIASHARKNPQKTYLIIGEESYTYSQIDILVNKACHLLQENNISKGDIISMIVSNSVEYVIIYMAGLRMGCPVNPYPYNLDSKDIFKYLGNIEPEIVFCQKKHYEEMVAYNQCKVFQVRKNFIKDSLTSRPAKGIVIETDYDSPACIYYSSGTTGNPKSIIFSHRNMVTNISSIVRGFHHTENDTHLVILPLGHTASVNYSFLPCTLIGATIFMAESFWKIRTKFWEIIKKHKINYVEVVPSVLVALANTPYDETDYSGINSLPYVGCGSASLPLEVQDNFYYKYGIKVANLYGLSETGPTHVDLPNDKGWESGSIGIPLDVNEIHIVDDNGQFLPKGEEGEIVVKGPNVFVGYKNNEELYNRTVKNGFFHTGDLGYIGKNGKHYFTGRKKDLIIKGGINISPDEIDEVIFKLEEVDETTSVGVSDKYLGEKIATYIVLKEGRTLESEYVRIFCQKYLSRDKIPDFVKFVESIPKGPSGKILRRKLKK